MKRDIIQTRAFARMVDDLIDDHRLLSKEFEAFKKGLCKEPESGDLIPGTGGVRKIRLKSAGKGKRGGFRICYFDDPEREELFLLKIYGKNEQEDLSLIEKRALKDFTELVKRR